MKKTAKYATAILAVLGWLIIYATMYQPKLITDLLIIN
ncbi:hypothetical protein [Caudoviricetes sp.]|nr:hypothetical protein [Caudoviricetes sp.]